MGVLLDKWIARKKFRQSICPHPYISKDLKWPSYTYIVRCGICRLEEIIPNKYLSR